MNYKRKYPDYKTHVIQKRVKIFARQIVNEDYEIAATVVLVHTAQVSPQEVKRVNEKKYSSKRLITKEIHRFMYLP